MHPRNPYYILDLPADATPGAIERQGRKLLGLFEVGAKKVRSYTCPLGTFDRDETMVREAMSALRDPERRAKDSCLASLLAAEEEPSFSSNSSNSSNSSTNDYAPDAPLEDAFLAGGYRGL